MYDTYLLPVLGPLVGQASDGDSRRRKLHLFFAKSQDGERYNIGHEHFTFSAKKTQNGVENLTDQDFIHNAKN